MKQSYKVALTSMTPINIVIVIITIVTIIVIITTITIFLFVTAYSCLSNKQSLNI